ncbi:alpha/beta fold hydrolase [Streptomyces sp. BBFR109]|uniref:alpha/beta fold hydrolase n=1 Tax=Streptomyces sp. BBFR109 TaxID=3448172 RepID=UPI003F76BE0D
MTDLYYDVCGTGPVLLILPGGAGHPMGLEPLTDRLAERFTVVTHDPLGLAHGRLGQPVADQRVEEWSEGARRVLDAVLPAGESAYVLGTSAGGVVALDLAVRHPGRLRHVVAHEPPCVTVLPDGERQRALFARVYDTYRAAGPQAAGALMGAVLAETAATDATGTATTEAPVDGQPLSPAEESASLMALFLAHVLRPFTAYAPPARPVDAPLTVAAGADSAGQLLHRTAALLAERCGGVFAEFPGGHIGAVEQPEAYADRLTEVLGFPTH